MSASLVFLYEYVYVSLEVESQEIVEDLDF